MRLVKPKRLGGIVRTLADQLKDALAQNERVSFRVDGNQMFKFFKINGSKAEKAIIPKCKLLIWVRQAKENEFKHRKARHDLIPTYSITFHTNPPFKVVVIQLEATIEDNPIRLLYRDEETSKNNPFEYSWDMVWGFEIPTKRQIEDMWRVAGFLKKFQVSKAGRPSIGDNEKAAAVKEWRNGGDKEAIAEKYQVTGRTLQNWAAKIEGRKK